MEQAQKPNIYQQLTQIVNLFYAGAQIQQVKTYRNAKGLWYLLLDFYPSPRNLLIFKGSLGVSAVEIPRNLKTTLLNLGEPAQNPLSLYLKAHLLNHRIEGAKLLNDDSFELVFASSGASVSFADLGAGILECSVDLKKLAPPQKGSKKSQGPRLFKAKLSLAANLMERFAEIDLKNENIEKSSHKISENKLVAVAGDKKRQRLLKNISQDLDEAEKWMVDYGAFVRKVETDPLLLINFSRLSLSEKEIAPKLYKEVGIHSVEELSKNLKSSLAKVFRLRKRAEKKIEGAKKRWIEVQSRSSDEGVLRNVHAPLKISEKKQMPRKKPGIWVELLKKELWARVGKSALENAELFRQAGSRDLWFHVRGVPGGHVWIPRGQKGLGAKEEPSVELIELGCQLALFNSKVKKQREAFVDYTERRYLKSVKGGAPGTLLIQRSQTLFVKLNADFEKRLHLLMRSRELENR